jgi:hypothetical protein
MRLETLAFRAEVDEIRALILSVVVSGLDSPSTVTSASEVDEEEGDASGGVDDEGTGGVDDEGAEGGD